MTNYSLTLVALFLIGLGLGDSPLVILSLCSLVLFFVISFCWFRLCSCFLLFFFLFFLFPSLYSLCCLMFSWGFFNIIFLLIKKKKRFLQGIIWDLGVLILLIGVLCVVVVGRLWVIYRFIVKRLIGCRVLFLNLLGFHESYLEWFLICFLVGGIGWGSTCLTLGI